MLKLDKPYFHFLLLWFPTVSVCTYIGTLLAKPLGHFLYIHNGRSESASNDGTSEFVFSLILLIGLFMGFGQWVAINTKIKKTHGWILATPIGFSVGSRISFLIYLFILPILPDPSKHYEVYQWAGPFGIWIGTCIFTGMCQWAILRRNILNSFKWSAVMILSFVIGIALVYFARATNFIIFSLIVGLISGVFAEPLIIRPEYQKEETAS